jgi:hypothetical protein
LEKRFGKGISARIGRPAGTWVATNMETYGIETAEDSLVAVIMVIFRDIIFGAKDAVGTDGDQVEVIGVCGAGASVNEGMAPFVLGNFIHQFVPGIFEAGWTIYQGVEALGGGRETTVVNFKGVDGVFEI